MKSLSKESSRLAPYAVLAALFCPASAFAEATSVGTISFNAPYVTITTDPGMSIHWETTAFGVGVDGKYYREGELPERYQYHPVSDTWTDTLEANLELPEGANPPSVVARSLGVPEKSDAQINVNAMDTNLRGEAAGDGSVSGRFRVSGTGKVYVTVDYSGTADLHTGNMVDEAWLSISGTLALDNLNDTAKPDVHNFVREFRHENPETTNEVVNRTLTVAVPFRNGQRGFLKAIGLVAGGASTGVDAFPEFPCYGDLDNDGDVDGTDVVAFIVDYRNPSCSFFNPCRSDFDQDGDVDNADLAVFREDFGKTSCPVRPD